MAYSYLAFDIEIVKPLPEGQDDWKMFRPLGISCAATLTQSGELRLWHGKTSQGTITERMNPIELTELVFYLEEGVRNGSTILTWNGLGFDFDILAEESGLHERCKALALDHVDMMFHVFCLQGFSVGLERAALGMGLAGKHMGMRGDIIPSLWSQGYYQQVLDYVAQDVRITLDLAKAVDKERGLQWKNRRGLPQYVPLREGWLKVREAMSLPLPDTSRMRHPWPRSKFTNWLVSPH
ncbi:MAG: ribonuclease H-like domain-containing protein [Chloroflexota bacterium]